MTLQYKRSHTIIPSHRSTQMHRFPVAYRRHQSKTDLLTLFCAYSSTTSEMLANHQNNVANNPIFMSLVEKQRKMLFSVLGLMPISVLGLMPISVLGLMPIISEHFCDSSGATDHSVPQSSKHARIRHQMNTFSVQAGFIYLMDELVGLLQFAARE